MYWLERHRNCLATPVTLSADRYSVETSAAL
jgi:hypothetical protein